MDAIRSDSFRVFGGAKTLQDLADQVPDLTRAGVEFVVIDGGEGRFGVREVKRLPGDLEKLKVHLDVGLDKVELIVVLPSVEVAARDFSSFTDGEIDDLVDVRKRVVGMEGAGLEAIYSAPGMLGGEFRLGGLIPDLPGKVFHIEGSSYTLKYCPHCERPYYSLLEVEGKGVCPDLNCRKEVRHCPHCGEPYLTLLEVDGKSVCPDCRKEVENCPHCGQPYLIFLEAEGKSVCLHCRKKG